MKVINYQRAIIIIIPLIIWFILVTLGVGPQSLVHLVEIPIVLVVSVVVCFFVTEKNFIVLLLALISFVVLLRLLIPLIPE